MKNKRALQLPRGADALAVNEAFFHRKVVGEIEDLLLSWGYLPMETPIVDFFDLYGNLMDERSVDYSYRLIDRDGELLLLRSDITLFMARQIGLHLKHEKLPLRLCYADTILRHEHHGDLSRNEFFQIGAELIGGSGIERDTEIILLLADVLATLGIDARIHIGSKALFSACFGGLPVEHRNKLKADIVRRDFDRLGEIAGKRKKRYLSDLFTFIGLPAEFTSFCRDLPPELRDKDCPGDELRYLGEICDLLVDQGHGLMFRVDLSELGSQAYHTGVAFSVYHDGVGSSIASGGRYDSLLRHFGFDAPSVGFSLFLRKIEPFISRQNAFIQPERIDVPKKGCFRDRLKCASEIRAKGLAAVL